GDECESRGAFGPLFPERLDFVIGIFEFGNGRAPKAENGFDLGGRALLARSFEDFANVGRERIGSDVGGGRDAEAKAAEVMVLVIVGVPTAMLLGEPKIEDDAVGEHEGFFGKEHGLARLIAPARSGIDAPGSVLLAIDGKRDWAIDAFLV